MKADIKIAKKSPNYNVGTNDDVQNEHFQFNYKSKTPEHTISREINDERVYKMPYSGYQNGIYDNMNKVDIVGPEYATNVPKFYLKYNSEPIQSEQHLMNLHYHNNFGRIKVPFEKKIFRKEIFKSCLFRITRTKSSTKQRRCVSGPVIFGPPKQTQIATTTTATTTNSTAKATKTLVETVYNEHATSHAIIAYTDPVE